VQLPGGLQGLVELAIVADYDHEVEGTVPVGARLQELRPIEEDGPNVTSGRVDQRD
jgi:hypothetical protein